MKRLLFLCLIVSTIINAMPQEILERRYNEVAYVFSHNGPAKGPSIVNNQLLSMKEQMHLGVRGTKTAVHYKEDWGGQKGGFTMMAAHGIDRSELYKNYYPQIKEGLLKASDALDKKVLMKLLGWINLGELPIEIQHLPELLKLYAKGIEPIFEIIHTSLPELYGTKSREGLKPFDATAVDPAARPIEDLLQDIKEFLDNNPKEIFTFRMEYYVNIDEVAHAIQKSGLLDYVHIQDKTQPWPKIGDMIENNKRLILFIFGKAISRYPWLHADDDYVWRTPFTFSTKKSLEAATDMPVNNKNFQERHIHPKNKIFAVPHFLTFGTGGLPSAADEVNEYSFLRKRMHALVKQAGVVPTWVNIDFVERPNKDVFQLVDALNGVGAYKGKDFLAQGPDDRPWYQKIC